LAADLTPHTEELQLRFHSVSFHSIRDGAPDDSERSAIGGDFPVSAASKAFAAARRVSEGIVSLLLSRGARRERSGVRLRLVEAAALLSRIRQGSIRRRRSVRVALFFVAVNVRNASAVFSCGCSSRCRSKVFLIEVTDRFHVVSAMLLRY
jgi:hypothetical protein